jgi:homoserine dehydrogenase
VVTAYYLRLRWPTRPACWPSVTGILAEHDISIDAVLQREADEVGRGRDARPT